MRGNKKKIGVLFLIFIYLAVMFLDVCIYSIPVNAAEVGSFTYDESHNYIEEYGGKYYFDVDKNTGVTLGSRLYDFLYLAYNGCLSTMSDDGTLKRETINGTVCWVTPIRVLITSSEDGLFYDALGNSGPTLVSKIQEGTIIQVMSPADSLKYRITVKSSEVKDMKLIFGQFLIELRKSFAKGLLSQSLVILNSSTDSVGVLSDIMEEVKTDSGTVYEFTEAFKSNLSYSSVYLLHPLYGVVSDVDNFITSCDKLSFLGFNYENKKVSHTSKGNFFSHKLDVQDAKLKAMGYKINSAYLNFLDDPNQYTKNFNTLDSNYDSDKFSCSFTYTCDNGYLCTKKPELKIKPLYMMSYMYPLAVPDYYTRSKNSSSNIFRMQNITTNPKYLCIDSVFINIKTNYVYYFKDGIYTQMGDFSDFDFSREKIYLHYSLKTNILPTDIESISDDTVKEQMKQGVAVMTELYEAVYDTVHGVETDLLAEPLTIANQEGTLYLTGRKVILGSKYGTDMPFDVSTSDTLKLTQGNTTVKTNAKFFAFGPYEDDLAKVNATNRNCHFLTTNNNFRFQTAFIDLRKSENGEGITGLCLIRNNYYANDTSLVNWLSGDEAKGISWVNAEDLLHLLTNSTTASSDILTYDQFSKLQVIKDKLAHLHDDDVYSIVRICLIVLGFLIVFYGALLFLSFLADVMDVGVGYNLLGKLSFGKLKACIPADYDYLKDSKDYKYVTWPQIFLRTFACFFFGLLLVNYELLLQFVIYLYSCVHDVFGIR